MYWEKDRWTGQESSLRGCKAQGKDSRGRKGRREEMGVEGGDFEQGEAQTVESYFRPDWN